MIDSLSLKFGSSPGQSKLKFSLTPITVFVGPNNAGKSLILQEIEASSRRASMSTTDLIVDQIEFTPYRSKDEMHKELLQLQQPPRLEKGEIVQPGHIIIGKINPVEGGGFSRMQLPIKETINEAMNPNQGHNNYFGHFLNMYTLRLDGSNRIRLLDPQKAGDLQGSPQNYLQHLFSNDKLRKKARKIVYDAFEKYFVIDPTKMGQLRVRLSDRAPKNSNEERGWDEKAVNFHKQAVDINAASDGVKAFTGIITTILAGDPRIILIDEPEAFLHPTLSNKLGKEIGNSIRGSHKRLFAATHSANFIMGLIQSGVPLNIVRLTYLNKIPTARLLPQDKLLKLMRNPLLRSIGVLDGLFYESVVVTESDADRAFYQEINERLINVNRGIPNCLFLNAQNKQTVWDIVKPLRALGIPTVGIVDIDAIKDGGAVWTNLLSGGFLPTANHEGLHNQRVNILKKFKEIEKNFKTAGGINLLAAEDKEAFENLLNQLKLYGIYILSDGELESWLPHLNIKGHGPAWLIKIFEALGEDPSDPKYIYPGAGDVWKFLEEVKTWLQNTKRKGIPV